MASDVEWGEVKRHKQMIERCFTLSQSVNCPSNINVFLLYLKSHLFCLGCLRHNILITRDNRGRSYQPQPPTSIGTLAG